MKTILIDAASILYPAVFSDDDFYLETSKGIDTTYVFSFLSELLNLGEKFSSNRIIIVFDSKKNNRKLIYPEYKANRKDVSEEIIEKRKALYKQIPLLKDVLSCAGFHWVEQEGFEADDLIASYVQNNPLEFVIVSNDHDLYQLLSKRTIQYRYSKDMLIDEEWFKEQYMGLEPKDYWRVLCIAGCHTDNVKGITGEKTATKYLVGALPGSYKAYKRIRMTKKIYIINEALVRLPFKGTPEMIVPMFSYKFTDFVKKAEELEFDSFTGKDLLRWKMLFELR